MEDNNEGLVVDDTTEDAETTATENTETTTAEDNVGASTEVKEDAKSLKDLIKEHPEYQEEINKLKK